MLLRGSGSLNRKDKDGLLGTIASGKVGVTRSDFAHAMRRILMRNRRDSGFYERARSRTILWANTSFIRHRSRRVILYTYIQLVMRDKHVMAVLGRWTLVVSHAHHSAPSKSCMHCLERDDRPPIWDRRIDFHRERV